MSIDITNLGKVFFPKNKLTKGDLMRYYTTVAPFILPVMADRPLVLKRFPNGVTGPSFFQQNAGETPEVVRTETIHTQGGSTNLRIVGGDLATLLYIVQLGSVSVDPWHARVQSLDFADYSIIDLDPGPRATFKRVVEVARWAKEVMDGLGSAWRHQDFGLRPVFTSTCRCRRKLRTKQRRSWRRSSRRALLKSIPRLRRSSVG